MWKTDEKLEKMQNSHWISWKIAPKASNMPSQDIWKFSPVSYRTSAFWGRYPALTPLLQLITPSRASGTADHVRSLDDLFSFPLHHNHRCSSSSSMYLFIVIGIPLHHRHRSHRYFSDSFPLIHHLNLKALQNICQMPSKQAKYLPKSHFSCTIVKFAL